MEWHQILGLGVVAAVFTALSNWISTWFFTYRPQQKSADYDAVRLSVILERFAYECANIISDQANWYASDQRVGGIASRLPPLNFPDEVVWKNLDIELLDRLLRFANDIERANGIICGEADHLQPELDVPVEARQQAGLMGYRAHLLARDLQSKYRRIKKRESLHPWNYLKVLKKQHDEMVNIYSELRTLDI